MNGNESFVVRMDPEEVFPAPHETPEGYHARMKRTASDISQALGGSMKAHGIGHGSEMDESLARKLAKEIMSGDKEALPPPPFVGSLYEEMLKQHPETPVEELIRARMDTFDKVRAEEETKKSSPHKSFVLEAAQDIVYGARQHMYGHASVNFARTAQMWEPIFGREVNNLQVGLAMILLKVARGGNLVQREAQGGAKATFDEIEDTLKDIAGYAEATMRSLFEDASGRRTTTK